MNYSLVVINSDTNEQAILKPKTTWWSLEGDSLVVSNGYDDFSFKGEGEWEDEVFTINVKASDYLNIINILNSY